MTDLTGRRQFFLGANSAGGFRSLYDSWVDQRKMQAFYVLKGGAGCGKSTLMGAVARQIEAVGYEVEYIRCSGDPDSLDGILIPEKGAAIVDGTSPHRLDPAYPGASGHYLNLGEGYDRKALLDRREEIIAATEGYRCCYPPAYRCIRAAAAVRENGTLPLHTEETLRKVEKRAAGILSRERKGRRTAEGRRSLRFLDGITCKGKLTLSQTVPLLCERGYEIEDFCGLAGPLLAHLEQGFLAGGYDTLSCLDSEQPSKLAHLFVPALSLGFVTGKSGLPLRTLHTESLVEKGALEAGKHYLRLANRMAEELLKDGVRHLAEARERHDALEALYQPHMDFSVAEELTRRTAEEILALPDRAG